MPAVPRKRLDLAPLPGTALLASDRILAVDPGKTTGCARADGLVITLSEHTTTESLWDELGASTVQTIICERYRVRPGQPGNPIALERIGALQEYATAKGIPIVYQDPSQAKFFWNNSNLKKFDLYVPGLQHARDAFRHLLYYWTFRTKQLRLVQRPTKD